MPRRRKRAGPVGLALAGGGPFGALYEAGALMALQEAVAGLELHDLDCYVGVSAGSFLAAALANGIPIEEIHDLVVAERDGDGGLTPELFMRPAWREYGRRARLLPGLLGRLAWRTATRPWSADGGAALSSLGRALPTGVFDNEAIHAFLAATFAANGRTNDFRALDRRLYIVATHLDSGETVSFGRPGHDAVPISRAVQASAALPGLFPPVDIDGRSYVDGALKKTLHASEALDDGARLVLCVNPIVPFDARLAALRGRGPQDDLVEGGLPLVLSQTFRAVIHSRMAVGFSKYASDYPGADVLLFQPEPDDGEVFLTNVFGYAGRQRICEHAYQRTRRDLARRAAELEPVLRRHGLGLRLDVLRDERRTLPVAHAPGQGDGLRLGRAAGSHHGAPAPLDGATVAGLVLPPMPDGNAIRTQRTRARILAESLALFNAHDEARVTTGMIAAAAGISPGNLHYHFRTREAIVLALFDAFERDAAAVPAPSRDGPEAVEDLWLYLHLMLEGIQRYRFLYRDLEGLPRRDRRLAERLRRVLERQRRVVAELLAALVRAGRMRASGREIDAVAANVLVVATFWPSFQAALRDGPGDEGRTSGQGAYQVMMLLVPYLAGDARRLIERLGRSYID